MAKTICKVIRALLQDDLHPKPSLNAAQKQLMSKSLKIDLIGENIIDDYDPGVIAFLLLKILISKIIFTCSFPSPMKQKSQQLSITTGKRSGLDGNRTHI
jgi:hypothetical protein